MNKKEEYTFWANKKLTIYTIIIISMLLLNLMIDVLIIVNSRNYENIREMQILSVWYVVIIWITSLIFLYYSTYSRYHINAKYIEKGLMLHKKIYWKDVIRIEVYKGRYLRLVGKNKRIFKLKLLGIKSNYNTSKELIESVNEKLKMHNVQSIDKDTDNIIDEIAYFQTPILFRYLLNDLKTNSTMYFLIICGGLYTLILNAVDIYEFVMMLVRNNVLYRLLDVLFLVIIVMILLTLISAIYYLIRKKVKAIKFIKIFLILKYCSYVLESLNSMDSVVGILNITKLIVISLQFLLIVIISIVFLNSPLTKNIINGKIRE